MCKRCFLRPRVPDFLFAYRPISLQIANITKGLIRFCGVDLGVKGQGHKNVFDVPIDIYLPIYLSLIFCSLPVDFAQNRKLDMTLKRSHPLS